jgi:hypothetical protein
MLPSVASNPTICSSLHAPTTSKYHNRNGHTDPLLHACLLELLEHAVATGGMSKMQRMARGMQNHPQAVFTISHIHTIRCSYYIYDL